MQLLIAALGIGKPGRGLIAHCPRGLIEADIRIVRAERRKIHRIDRRSARAEQHQRSARRRKPERDMKFAARIIFQRAVRIYDRCFTGLQHAAREREDVRRLFGFRQRIAREIDLAIRDIHNLDPVRRFALFAQERRFVYAHQLVDAHGTAGMNFLHLAVCDGLRLFGIGFLFLDGKSVRPDSLRAERNRNRNHAHDQQHPEIVWQHITAARRRRAIRRRSPRRRALVCRIAARRTRAV